MLISSHSAHFTDCQNSGRLARTVRMAVWDKTIIWSFMFLLAGAVGASVKYPDPVCAVKGSTVTLLCTFTPLKSVVLDGREVLIEINRVRWCQNHLICQGPTPSVYDSFSENNNPRYKYLGDKKENCTLQITDVQLQDDAMFHFRMEANFKEGHYTGQSGVKVTVTDQPAVTIHSSSDDAVMSEGQNVTLHCSISCSFHQLVVTWFKDDHALSESGPTLHLSPLTAKDSGNYTCGFNSSGGKRSLPYRLHVEAEEEDDTEDKAPEEGNSVNLPLIAGVASGVLLAVITLILVLCIIRRKQAAAASEDPSAVAGDVDQKCPNNTYSNILQPAEQHRGLHRQESSRAAEELSYAAVQFKLKSQDRRAVEAEEAIIYSALAS